MNRIERGRRTDAHCALSGMTTLRKACSPTPMTYDDIRRIVLALPGIEERTSYGTPALFVGKKLLVRLKEDGRDVVLRMSLEEKAFLMEADPDTFYETDHYKGWPAVLARLEKLDEATVRTLTARQWRASATRTLLKAHPGIGA
jgi:hypothetical protein